MVRPRPTLILLVLLVLAGCGPTTSASPSGAPTLGASPTATDAASPGATTATSPAPSAAATTVRAYFILGSHTDDGGLVPVLRSVPQTEAVGAAAMTALLAGPNTQELGADPAMYSWIPSGTRFLGLTITAGVATVDLSTEFQAGGDTESVAGRMAQVVYTLTQFPTVHGVRFEFEGVPPKTVFIGELGRADFTELLPAIWVDAPAWGGVLGNPAQVAGLANVFEARFQVEILDAAGHSLIDQAVTASCGTGCWGTFDVTIPYSVASAQAGTLRVYDTSEQGGTREHIVEYPISLTP
jgi:germination protein M